MQLQLILKRNNISLAKQFFIQNPVEPNKLLGYDYQVRLLSDVKQVVLDFFYSG